MANKRKLRLAVIGCGAVSRIFYLPAIEECGRFDLAVLADTFLPNARQFAEKYGVPSAVEDYREIVGKADAAVVALPNYLHAPVAIDLLQRGVHVLVEKPMALNTGECDAMMLAAGRTGALLAVGLDFRYFHYARFVKQLLESKLLGDIISFELHQGVVLTWSSSSDYMLRKQTSGGGVLSDFGPHMIDLLLWWLGDYENVEYYDDASGGVEANCVIRVRLKNGASGVVELSRMRNLSNRCEICGSRGTLEFGIWDFNPTMRLRSKDRDLVFEGHVVRTGKSDTHFKDAFCRELEDFADAIVNRREPFIPGREGRRSVEFIETCYSVKQQMIHDWDYKMTQNVSSADKY